MTNQLRFGLVLAFAFATWANLAQALDDSDKEAIRSLSNQAADDFEQGRYEAAKDKFSRAYRIAEVPKLAVWAARANEKLGHLVTAYELYLRALSLQPNDLWKADVQQQAKKDAQDELDKLQPRIPKLTIVIEGANSSDISVNVDNVQVPSDLLGVERYADPGQRKITAKARQDDGTKPKSSGRRNLAVSTLPMIRVEITHPELEGKAERIGFEESWKLGYERGGQRRILVARVVYRLPEQDPETGALQIVKAEAPAYFGRNEHSFRPGVNSRFGSREHARDDPRVVPR